MTTPTNGGHWAKRLHSRDRCHCGNLAMPGTKLCRDCAWDIHVDGVAHNQIETRRERIAADVENRGTP